MSDSDTSSDDDLLTSSYKPLTNPKKSKVQIDTSAHDAFTALTESAASDLEQKKIRGVYIREEKNTGMNMSEIAQWEKELNKPKVKESEFEDDELVNTTLPSQKGTTATLAGTKKEISKAIKNCDLQRLIDISSDVRLEGILLNCFTDRYYDLIEDEAIQDSDIEKIKFPKKSTLPQKITSLSRLPALSLSLTPLSTSNETLLTNLRASILKIHFKDQTCLELLKDTYENSKTLEGSEIHTRLRLFSLLLSSTKEYSEIGNLLDGIKRNVLGAFVDEDVQRVKEMCGVGKVWVGWVEENEGKEGRRQSGIEEFF